MLRAVFRVFFWADAKAKRENNFAKPVIYGGPAFGRAITHRTTNEIKNRINPDGCLARTLDSHMFDGAFNVQSIAEAVRLKWCSCATSKNSGFVFFSVTFALCYRRMSPRRFIHRFALQSRIDSEMRRKILVWVVKADLFRSDIFRIM